MENEQWVAWLPESGGGRPQYFGLNGKPVYLNDEPAVYETERAVRMFSPADYKPLPLSLAENDDRYWQQTQISWESWPGVESELVIRVTDSHGGKALDFTFVKFTRVILTLVHRYKAWPDGYLYDGRPATEYDGLGPASLLFSPAQIMDAILSREGMLPEPSERRIEMYRPLWELEGEDEG